ncbi:MAG TPA: CapA family protein [Anaerolineaceae bacterium]|jgi:poly-gamma-glutamate synthesis protein (capsule biosynthesis protein)|nr:CapA family protein [Anaerolineaceae bacterium]
MISIIIILSILLGACGSLTQPAMPAEPVLPAESPTPEPITTKLPPTPEPTPAAIVPMVWLDPRLPEELQILLGEMPGVVRVSNKEEALLSLTIDSQKIVSSWVYALAAPFTTVTDDVSMEELTAFWKTNAAFPARVLVMPPAVFDSLKARFGIPVGEIHPLAEENLLNYCETHKDSWAVVPFEKLEPRWKVISIDGNSPVHKGFATETYPLIVNIGWDEGPRAVNEAEYHIADEAVRAAPVSNRQDDLLTTVVLTGVTAMTRGTGKEMEMYGVLSPAVSVGALMREADIAHVSNEVPFDPNCPAPQWIQEEDLVFCSADKYIDLLREIGTDVVELTGDHFSDFGPEAMHHTLEMYESEGWSYYGGGKDIHEAKQPLKITHNGNKIAFMGCNAKAPGYATASETNPGALHCDLDEMVNTIQTLRDEGYLVIFTFQHQEIYRWNPTEEMIADSRRVADAGATIVSGSQAHQPHTLEFYGDSFIHYGLGNLFFDQLGWFEDSNKTFLDRHIFYNGNYLGVELITAQFFNWSTPTLMTPEARAEVLRRLFAESALLK